MSVPSGEKIQIDEENKKLVIPDNPIIPFIEGDGIGPDIWYASQMVFDAAVEKAYEGKKKISWLRSSPARRRMKRPVNGFPRKPPTR